MDEPASALDPIATQKIEETINELKHEFTIIIITHNMQQAVRVSDYTGFMYLGKLVEFRETKKLFTDHAKEELIDIWHFVVQASLELGLKPKDILKNIKEKNAINHKRQREGY